MKDKIKAIREKCIDADSSIKDLKMGCWIKIDSSCIEDKEEKDLLDCVGGFGRIVQHEYFDSNRDEYGAPDDEGMLIFEILLDGGIYVKYENKVHYDDIEIIGRDIRLYDIMRTCTAREKYMSNDDYRAMIYSIWTSWGSKDNLEEQSEFTIDFIYDLLIKDSSQA